MSTPVIDNLIALRVLYMLVTPFDKTEAFKAGVIDSNGTLLVKVKDQTADQRRTYDYLNRLVFNLKRLIEKVPGGKSTLASYIAALYLVKEDTKMSNAELEFRFNSIMSKIDDGVVLVEETIIVEKFLKDLEEDGAPAGVGGGGQVGVPSSNSPANVTGAKVSTDIAVIRKKKKTPIAQRPKVAALQ